MHVYTVDFWNLLLNYISFGSLEPSSFAGIFLGGKTPSFMKSVGLFEVAWGCWGNMADEQAYWVLQCLPQGFGWKGARVSADFSGNMNVDLCRMLRLSCLPDLCAHLQAE